MMRLTRMIPHRSSMALAISLVVPNYLKRQLIVGAFSVHHAHPSSFAVVGASPIRHVTKTALSSAAGDEETPFQTWTYDEPCTEMAWTELKDVTPTIVDASADYAADADLVLLGVFGPKKEEDEDDGKDEDEEEKEPTVELDGAAKALDEKLGGAISQLMLENFKSFKNGASAGSTTPTLRVFADGTFKRYAVVGLGPAESEDGLLDVGAGVGKALATKCDEEKKVANAKLVLPGDSASDDAFLTDVTAGFYGNLYADNRFRTGDKKKDPAEDLSAVTFVAEGGVSDSAADAIAKGHKLAMGTYMCKDIVNAPHNVLNSLSLADTAKKIAEESGGTLKCTILDKDECEKRGMGAFLGVARASETEPQFIHLTYTPPDGKVNKRVGIVGKGLLFDTGGYNIKTAMMELMKFDCGGSAAVLGAARSVAALQPPGVEAHFLVAACENMINAKGYVPSDILTASNGKTIEVLNTDAEGRLTMADALVYADKELDCESVVELSTLTGACMIALGSSISGLWTSDDDLAEELLDIAKVTGEKTWRMPMEKSYNKQLESKIADIKNIGERYGGSITAALFLQNFVDKKKPFAHIDIAGPVWDTASGATGYGSNLVTEWVRRQGLEKKDD